MRFKTCLKLGTATALAAASAHGVAFAQEAEADAAGQGDIVVTGTLIRGVEAVGSQTIGVDSQAILEQGALSTNEILSRIPQIANSFNGRFEGDPRGASQDSINRPNLRNLPGYNAASGSVTLVLVDGHRVTPIGVNESAIDVDVVPAIVLQSVQVMTDGGSSIYGADAVSGVINFITRKEFNGIKVDANYGFGTTISNFDQWDASIIAGTSWANGNAYIAYTHSDRDGLRNRDTSWARQGLWQEDGTLANSGTQCLTPVGSEIRYFKYGAADTDWTSNPAAPGAGTFPIGSACDEFAADTYLSKQRRDSVFASVTQQVSDSVEFHATAYFTQRKTTFFDYPLGYTTPAQAPSFPVGAPVGSIYAALGGIGFSFSAHPAYVERNMMIDFDTWGFTPELKVDLGGGWQLRNMAHFGRSNNSFRDPRANNLLAQAYIDAGQLDPQNVAAASEAVVTDILDYESAQDTVQQLFIFRTIADGPLFAVPGGDVKLAVGVEYQNAMAKTRQLNGRRGALSSIPWQRGERNTKSVFGELSIPLLSFLDLSASVRHDEYSDFGSTTNPNLGARIKPVEWLSIYGHWGKSFNAPTVLDSFGIATATWHPTNTYAPGSPPVLHGWDGVGTGVVHATGTSASLKPQTGETWAVGFEAKPVEGLRVGANYYSINFNHILGAVDPQQNAAWDANPEKFIVNPTQEQLDAFLARLANADELRAQVTVDNVAYLLDRITANLTSAKLRGLDFNINYDRDVSFGHLSFGFAGNKQFKVKQNNSGIIRDVLEFDTSTFTATGNVGWRNDNWSTKLTVNYSSGYDYRNYKNEVARIGAFVTTDLFIGYDFDETGGALNGTSLRLVVDNLLNEKPEVAYQNNSNLAYRNWTLGRVIKLGFSKEF